VVPANFDFLLAERGGDDAARMATPRIMRPAGKQSCGPMNPLLAGAGRRAGSGFLMLSNFRAS